MIPEPWSYEGPNGIRIVDVRTPEELVQRAAAWANLLQRSPGSSPVSSYPHMSAFFETRVAPERQWLCLFAYEGDRLVGVCPLVATRAVGVAGFAAVLLQAPFDVTHTGGVDCVVLPGRDDVVGVFHEYLTRMPRSLPVVRYHWLDRDSASMRVRDRSTFRHRTVAYVSGSQNYIPVPRVDEDFHQRLSKNFRRQLRRGRQRLERYDNVRYVHRDSERSTAENLRRFEDTEDAGWKGEGRTSVKSGAGGAGFFELAAERYHEHGWMQWDFLEVDGRPVAAHYGIRMNRTLYLLKIGYDEDFGACGPGNLLLEQAVEAAAEAGDVDEINCMTDWAWHERWAMRKRWNYDVVVLPRIPIATRLLVHLLDTDVVRRRLGWPKHPPLDPAVDGAVAARRSTVPSRVRASA